MKTKTACAAMFLTGSICLSLRAAPAGAQGWMQDDWSGGPGQAAWSDGSRYDSSTRGDTMSEPGTVRLSFLGAPYTKDSSNPVVRQGGAGAWDEGEVSGFPREREGGGYELLYRGENAAGIRAVGYASSDNGVSWTKYSGNPVLTRSATTSWDKDGVGTGPLVTVDGTHHLFFKGYEDTGTTMIYRYGHATSTDMVNWTRETNYVIGGGAAGSWDEDFIYGTVRHINGTFHLWYLAYDNANRGGIGHATSPDGSSWTKDPANPVFGPGSPGEWDDTSIDDFVILERPWADDYMMAYAGTDAAFTSGIGLATSPDGVHWTKDASNPLFSSGGPTWFGGLIFPYSLVFDGSLYRMGLSGMDTTIPPHYHYGEAWYENGPTWTMNFANPLLSPGASGSWDDLGVFSAAPFLEDDSLRLFYVGINSTGTSFAVGTATATPSYNATGELVSSVFDAGAATKWRKIKWNESTPAGTDVKVEIRSGDTAAPDGAWTGWAEVTNGGGSPHAAHRYTQYRLTLSTTDPGVSPEVFRISFDMPIDLTPNAHEFSTSDAITVTADILPISTPFYPFIRLTLPSGQTLYLVRGRGLTAAPASYLPGGPFTTPVEINGYPVVSASFSGVAAGDYVLEGGAVDATRTTSASSLVYIEPVDSETLTVQ